ncbi:long-chain fatty acid transport protein [Nonlabens tegetincola]|uniref:Long-chain fatty acid transport protein n=1 Tax=Nonlabens tegetincola TaxID=323273 RepID=A0A090Q317_9FLAO|nr:MULTISPECIES: outer membrane protein transport protein [Nonlabens]ALM21266.1 transporter [Nonlabens sp. MIC269]ARN72013.1 transporter [Nonlabens tegetincola]MEE2800853.1 outer membrane protein transport protein [Bacteroidota bacterium]GAK96133.1 long-chain fatty acid transport protein [Nonlabens tegetincola]
MNKLKLFLVLGLVSAMAYAGGYRVSTQSNKQLAMGHTGVAVVNSADILFFNPAGLVHLESKLSVSAGGFGVFSDVAYQNAEFGTFADTDSPTGTPIYLYATYKVTDKFSAGIGVYTPYGSNVTWPTDWSGSHLVNEIELQAIFIQPTLSYQLFDSVSIGGGPILAIGGVEFNRNASRSLVDEEGTRSNVSIEDSGVTGWGWTAGLLFTPTDNFSLGFNYRSLINIESTEGTATFSNFPNSTLVPSNGTQGFTATLPLPAEATVGLSYKLNDKWLFAFDYNRAFWSEYENLDIEFADGSSSINPRNYKDSSTYRLGAQYTATDKFVVRAGWYYDESPVQSGYFAPETPRNDSQGYTFGFTYQVSSKFAIDASLLYLRFKEINESYDFYSDPGAPVNAPFAGTYKSQAIIPGIGITYNM